MIVKQLSKYIEDSGLKKMKVAQLIGCSKEHLSYILNGHRIMSDDLERRVRDLIS